MLRLKINDDNFEFDIDSIVEEIPDILAEYIYDNVVDEFGIHCGAFVNREINHQLTYMILKRALRNIEREMEL